MATAEISAATAKSGETEKRCRADCEVRFFRSRVKGKHSLCQGIQGWNET